MGEVLIIGVRWEWFGLLMLFDVGSGWLVGILVMGCIVEFDVLCSENGDV